MMLFSDIVEAEALIEQAGEECGAAAAELGDAIESGDRDRLDAAYARLLSAQEALKEAENELRLSREAFSEEREAELKEEIDDLKNKVSDLESRLDKAMITDISNYRATIPKETYVYTGNCIYPKLTVAGMKKSEYEAFYDNNIVPKKAKIADLSAGARKLTVKAGTKVQETGSAKYEIQYREKSRRPKQ